MRTPLKHQKRWLPLVLGLAVLAGCSNSDTDPEPGTDDPGPGIKPGTGSDCMGATFLSTLGKDRLLVGAQMEDETATKAPFDVRYLYIAAGLFDSNEPCTSCLSCTSGGASCDNSNGCNWWGCWQWDQEPPGDYVRGFIATAKKDGQIPFITYYEEFQASGETEGEAQLAALNNASFLRRYLGDWRFLLKQVGNEKVLLQIEPDLWAYLQFFGGGNPRSTPVAVTSANPTDCAGMENNAAGLGKCMIAMTRKYAPNAKVGLHASAWATQVDVSGNTDASFDVVGEANKVADFLTQVGAKDGDFVTVEASDRDAGYYDDQGRDTWWDPENRTLPHFKQAFTWVKAISERLGKPNIWWQLPVGNMSLSNRDQQWRDNRVDYFFSHPAEVAAAHGAGFLFGAGQGEQTTPETDGGNLVNKVKAYKGAGGQSACVN